MAPMAIWSNLRSKILQKPLQKSRGLSRGLTRGLAVVAIVVTYGLGQAAVTGAMMTASTTPVHAYWRGRGRGWGYRGRGWRGRGWGYRGWRGRGWCYYHPYACRGW